MEENWRDVPGMRGYQISIDTPEGSCRSLNFNHTGVIKTLSNKPRKRDKRIYWTLCKGHKTICRQAARWIAITYPELVQNEYFEGAVIDHIDTNRLNNHPSNLRWVTPKENINNPLTKIHRSESLKGRRTNRGDLSLPVEQYDKQGNLISTYPSIMEAERKTGVRNTQISYVCSNKPKYKTAGGFIWKYKEKEAV